MRARVHGKAFPGELNGVPTARIDQCGCEPELLHLVEHRKWAWTLACDTALALPRRR